MERRVLFAIFLSFLVLVRLPGPGREASAEARRRSAPARGRRTAGFPATPPDTARGRRRRFGRRRTSVVGDTARFRGGRAGDPGRDQRRHGCVHEPRRPAQELAAEALPGRSRQPQELDRQELDIPTAAGTVNRQPLPFTLKVPRCRRHRSDQSGALRSNPGGATRRT